jgi:prepilin-type N-terminal cleavage/methylation domain-containing protein
MQQHTEMRKGISLVEMMIAIILFAALSTIGLKYYKLYINTDLQAMKARNAAAMEEASQLTGAYKLFTTQYGVLSSIYDLNGTDPKILTNIPLAITEMTTAGWDYNTSFGTAGLKGFHMPLDRNTTATSDEQYCALWNKEFNSSIELNVTDGQDFGSIDALSANYTSFCATTGGTYHIYVVMP